MTKDKWKTYREALPSKGIIEGDQVVVYYHWNYGSTAAKRARSYQGKLTQVDDLGIIVDRQRKRYKFLEGLSSLADAYEPDDAVQMPEGWRSL